MTMSESNFGDAGRGASLSVAGPTFSVRHKTCTGGPVVQPPAPGPCLLIPELRARLQAEYEDRQVRPGPRRFHQRSQ